MYYTFYRTRFYYQILTRSDFYSGHILFGFDPNLITLDPKSSIRIRSKLLGSVTLALLSLSKFIGLSLRAPGTFGRQLREYRSHGGVQGGLGEPSLPGPGGHAGSLCSAWLQVLLPVFRIQMYD